LHAGPERVARRDRSDDGAAPREPSRALTVVAIREDAAPPRADGAQRLFFVRRSRRFKAAVTSIAPDRTGASGSPTFSKRAGAVLIVKRAGSRRAVTSSQRSGHANGAPLGSRSSTSQSGRSSVGRCELQRWSGIVPMFAT